MKRRALLLGLGALMALPGMVSMPSAHAAAFAIVFTGTAHLPTFPCNATCGGSFSGKATGSPSGTLNLTYSYHEPSATCPAQGSAHGGGTLAGKPFTFNWTRVGLSAVLTVTYNGTTGAGTAVFVPSKTACNGAARTATVVGTVAG